MTLGKRMASFFDGSRRGGGGQRGRGRGRRGGGGRNRYGNHGESRDGQRRRGGGRGGRRGGRRGGGRGGGGGGYDWRKHLPKGHPQREMYGLSREERAEMQQDPEYRKKREEYRENEIRKSKRQIKQF